MISGVLAAHYPTSIWGSTPGGSGESKNTWSCTSAPSYRSVAWSLIRHTTNFTLPLASDIFCSLRRFASYSRSEEGDGEERKLNTSVGRGTLDLILAFRDYLSFYINRSPKRLAFFCNQHDMGINVKSRWMVSFKFRNSLVLLIGLSYSYFMLLRGHQTSK
jgi:hypothetical protein